MNWVGVLLILAALATGRANGAENPHADFPSSIMAVDETTGLEDLGVVDGPGIAGKQKGTRFTQKKKEIVKQDNSNRNEGKNRCESCGVETVPAQQHKKGVTPPDNETQVDHVVPKAKGGKGEPDNGQVLCRDCNLKKGDKGP
ncbi:HNH endonuclease signature motif containing protein [Archangium sp.]|uniref:HNH endonuclease n=1 Tax=Archangium sp. TaxID=1872627 RepID=UPI00286C134F|nr:HNH endonuclease signature motif containing protein [Archangium sp.]